MENKTCVCEYLWIGGNNEIRSKTKVLSKFCLEDGDFFNPANYPNWNYDGSSTGQSDSDGDTEVSLIPRTVYKNPLRKMHGIGHSMLILCDTYEKNDNPLKTNTRYKATKIFEKNLSIEPWFGLEQEYFIQSLDEEHIETALDDEGKHYCASFKTPQFERRIVEEHLDACIYADLTISGLNAEVACHQWEFQIGPCIGIKSGDQVIVARYLLENIAQSHGCIINYDPKPYTNVNGSGCHVNFSTIYMRAPNGMISILDAITKLGANHKKHIELYGANNDSRLSGTHETSSIDEFSWGIGTRNTSIRIPNDTSKYNCGYFEDRRPGSNIDPYVVTSTIFETCCLFN